MDHVAAYAFERASRSILILIVQGHCQSRGMADEEGHFLGQQIGTAPSLTSGKSASA
jgi:hypothetical protein